MKINVIGIYQHILDFNVSKNYELKKKYLIKDCKLNLIS